MFKKILIANRGEIAVRILRACRELGIRAVAVYSDADRASLHVRLADEAYRLGPAPSRESYLSIEKSCKPRATRQGAMRCIPATVFSPKILHSRALAPMLGSTFIGPSPEAMEQLGSKTAARHLASDARRSHGSRRARSHRRLLRLLWPNRDEIRVSRGAESGCRRWRQRHAPCRARSRTCRRVARRHVRGGKRFGDGRLYLEKYLPRPRHIEIQVLGDHHGNMVYLGERECSVQRRHQKVIEEAPSPIMTPNCAGPWARPR